MKIEKDKDFLYIYEGGSEKGKMIANMTGKKIDTHISIPGNQMYIEFHTNGNIEAKGFYAKILESMYLLPTNIIRIILRIFLLSKKQAKNLVNI